MNYSLRPVLEDLNEGRGLKAGAALLLRLMAVLTAIGGLYLVGKLIVDAFDLSVGAAVGAIFFALLLGVALFGVVQVLLYRAGKVSGLEDSSFTAIPIVSHFARAAGESYAVMGMAVALGGCVFIWLAGFDPTRMLGGWGSFFPGVEAGNTFLSGLVFLVSTVVVVVLNLFFAYLVAELIVVLADIANNTRALREDGGGAAAGGRQRGGREDSPGRPG